MDNVDNPLKGECGDCQHYADSGNLKDGHCNNLDSYVLLKWTGCLRWKQKEQEVEKPAT